MCSERVEEEKQLYCFFPSLPGLKLFQRLNSLHSGVWVHLSLRLPGVGGDQQAISLLRLKGCALSSASEML